MDLSSKIAVCISGQIRTGVDNSKTLLNYIGNMRSACDVFIHTWDTNSKSAMAMNAKTEEERQLIRNTFTTVGADEINQIADIYQPLDMRVDNLALYQAAHLRRVIMRNGSQGAQIPMFQSIWEVNRLKTSHEQLCCSKYNIVVRLRFDVAFPSDRTLLEDLNYIGSKKDFLYFVDVDNKYPDAIEDICWMSSSSVMDIACNFAIVREIADSPLDWQLHMKEYLDNNNIRYRPFKNNTINIIR